MYSGVRGLYGRIHHRELPLESRKQQLKEEYRVQMNETMEEEMSKVVVGKAAADGVFQIFHKFIGRLHVPQIGDNTLHGTHVDYQELIDGVAYFGIAAAFNNTGDDETVTNTYGKTGYFWKREKGTYTELLADIITIVPEEKMIYAKRIGAGVNRSLSYAVI